jgi:hypothetical protein
MARTTERKDTRFSTSGQHSGSGRTRRLLDAQEQRLTAYAVACGFPSLPSLREESYPDRPLAERPEGMSSSNL